MRLPAQIKQRKAQSISITAPVGGWNTRDPLDRMPPEDAVELTNWFPSQGYVETRTGFTSWATGLGGDVEALYEFNAGASRKLIAAANGNIWNISTFGTGTSLASGFSSNRWDAAQFDDSSGGARMGLVNGTDAPQIYDGSTVSAMTVSGSGLMASTLTGIHIFKNRSFFWAANSQDFWYSASEALGGSLTKFPLGRVSGFGGNLIAMGTLSIDGGEGIDDHACFFMSSGDVLVYAGTDPGDASAWALVGIFRMGAPLGRRGVVKFGGDLLVMTRDGYNSVAANFGRERGFQSSISDKISSEVRDVAQLYKDNFGWQAQLYPRGQYLLFNIPVSSSRWDQHIYNTVTGAWCKFEGQNGACWSQYDNDLYFGGLSGVVYQADSGLTDGGSAKTATAQQAWTYLGDRGNTKRITTILPSLAVNNTSSFDIGVGVDFKTPTTSTRVKAIPKDTRVTSTGDTRVTSAGDTRVIIDVSAANLVEARYGVLKEGRSVSVKISVDAVTNRIVRWYSTQYTWEQGSIG